MELCGDVGVVVGNHAIAALLRDGDTFAGSPLRGLGREYTWCWQRFDIDIMAALRAMGESEMCGG